ncbi:uncharacterized protein LOC125440163 [Sphaerodactylus townsendi]|uniref:uncharacterized protein LOC125440163 n=1 Tax=Sphaerodactylus townsendi TaxID=933632 RepID=UPI00202640AD|nr:uncharacterized protein LOC125440163 [Sphaerodactylus townsendi]
MGGRRILGYSKIIILVVWGLVVPVESGWHDNEFHKIVRSMSTVANVSDCWVCSRGPSSSRQGWPIIPISTLTLVEWNNTEVWGTQDPGDIPGNRGSRFFTDPDQFLLARQWVWPPAPLCFQWHNQTKKGYIVVPIKEGYQSKTEKGGSLKTAYFQMSRIEVGNYPKCENTISLTEDKWSVCNETNPWVEWPFSCGKEEDRMGNRVIIFQNQKGMNSLIQLQLQAIEHNGNRLFGLPEGLYWICGRWAGKILPSVWNGTCTIGMLAMGEIRYYDTYQPLQTWDRQFGWARVKRAYDEALGYDPENTYLTEAERFGAILFPAVGVALNVKQIRRISAQLEILANVTSRGMWALQTETESLAQQLTQHKIALDYVLSKEGGLCFWLNTTCCHYVNASGEIEEDINKLHLVAKRVRSTYTPKGESWFSWLMDWISFPWLKNVFLFIVMEMVIGVMICICMQCLPLLSNCTRTTQSGKQELMALVTAESILTLEERQLDAEKHNEAMQCKP